MSIFVFYKISTSILTIFITFWRHFLQVLSKLTSDSTTFKVAVSHFVFYTCGALSNWVTVVISVENENAFQQTCHIKADMDINIPQFHSIICNSYAQSVLKSCNFVFTFSQPGCHLALQCSFSQPGCHLELHCATVLTVSFDTKNSLMFVGINVCFFKTN